MTAAGVRRKSATGCSPGSAISKDRPTRAGHQDPAADAQPRDRRARASTRRPGGPAHRSRRGGGNFAWTAPWRMMPGLAIWWWSRASMTGRSIAGRSRSPSVSVMSMTPAPSRFSQPTSMISGSTFPPEVREAADRPSPSCWASASICASCLWSPSMAAMPETSTMRSSRARRRREQSGRLADHRRDRRCRPLCPPWRSARCRGAHARKFHLFPRSRPADAARSALQRPLLASPRRGQGVSCRAYPAGSQRQEAKAPLRARPDALGSQADLRTGAGGEGWPAGRAPDL